MPQHKIGASPPASTPGPPSGIQVTRVDTCWSRCPSHVYAGHYVVHERGLTLVHPAHPEAPSVISPAPRSLHVPRAEQRPLTIRPPSPVRADVQATRLAAALPAGSSR